jgi:outer membrane receptor protein involved in Fe transport
VVRAITRQLGKVAASHILKKIDLYFLGGKSMQRYQTKISRAIYATLALSGASIGFVGSAGAAESKNLEEVVVTGSLIRNANLVRSAPVNVIGGEEIEYQAIFQVEEILREIPGAVPSVGANVNNGNGGFSYVNLRGLGSNRNLVLVDGRRMAPSELNGRFDLNNIPVALIERVEVLTGGASTTYGADAIAGVVNFMTKSDFEGLEVNVSWGETAEGDGGRDVYEITAGSNFADNRGNAVFSVGIQESEPVYQGDRVFSEFVHFYFNGARGGSGLGSFNSRFGNVNPTGVDNENLGLGGVQDDRTFAAAFTPFNYGPANVFQTPFDRKNMYSAITYEINDTMEFYGQALFSQNQVNTLIAPSGSFGDSVTVALNHPLMSDAQRNSFCAFDTDNAEGSYVPRFSQAECDAAGAATGGPGTAGYQQVDTQLRRRNVEGGPRISDYTANYFNFMAGLRGDLSDTIQYDINASYGKSDQTQTQKGYWLKSRFRQSLLSGPDGCFDSSSGCLPVDFFGPTGSITADMVGYLQGGESKISTVFDLTQYSANMSGEAGFSLPTVDQSAFFALGFEKREYTGGLESDLLSQSGDLGGAGGASPNIFGSYDVVELVAEGILPILEGETFAEELTFEAGYRYSVYNVDAAGSSVDTTDTWKLGLSWSPIEDLKLRSTFARAVRAPNIAELFSPVTTGLGNTPTDPCASVDDEGNNSGFVPDGALRDACIAQGAPAGAIGFIPQPAAGQVNTTGGGNLNLAAEESDSLTIGFVYQPSFLPAMTVSVDYYDITVDGSINSPTEDDVLALCFNNPSATSAACTSIVRSPIDGGLSGDEAVVKGLPLGLSNTGNLATSGYDVAVTYFQEFGVISWTSNFAANRTSSSTFQAVTGVSLDRECVGLYSSNCASIQPKTAFNWRNTFRYDNISASLMWRYISSNEYENRATDTAFAGVPEGNVLGSQNFNETDAYHLWDLTLRYQPTENIALTGVVSNLFNEDPPLTGAFIGATGFNSGNTYPSTFDALGRRYNVMAKLTF